MKRRYLKWAGRCAILTVVLFAALMWSICSCSPYGYSYGGGGGYITPRQDCFKVVGMLGFTHYRSCTASIAMIYVNNKQVYRVYESNGNTRDFDTCCYKVVYYEDGNK